MNKNTKIIKICTGKRCSSRFSGYIFSRLEADKKFYNYDESIIIEPSICMWKCDSGPNIKIDNEIFSGQNPIKSSELLKSKVDFWKNSHKKSEKNLQKFSKNL